MKISTKGRYALRLMLDLAEHADDGYIALKDIAKRQGISKKYLEQIIPMLNTPDLLRTNRGFQVGYRLAQPPENYTVGMIQQTNPCERADECATLYIWEGLNKVINDYLDNITLQDILDKERESYSNNYII